jgi:N-acetylglucosaminylphosphatidylinositol deacetylase
VLAHPDDESVFFTPIITYLRETGHRVSLLTLTAGDFCDGYRNVELGLVRLKELIQSCDSLGVSLSRWMQYLTPSPFSVFS